MTHAILIAVALTFPALHLLLRWKKRRRDMDAAMKRNVQRYEPQAFEETVP